MWFPEPQPATSWREIDRDESHRIPLITYRCQSCRKLAVSTNLFLFPRPCGCGGKR